jgi:hypothetical protein
MTRADDRTVHARYEGAEIVRYNRAGKWYIEPTDGRTRTRVNLAAAVEAARWGVENRQGVVHYGAPGGSDFDLAMARLARTQGEPTTAARPVLATVEELRLLIDQLLHQVAEHKCDACAEDCANALKLVDEIERAL